MVMRPADANEVAEAYKVIMAETHQPCILVLSRQAVPTLDRSKLAPASGVAKGAYVLADTPGKNLDVLLIATGSEVGLAVKAHERLVKEGIGARVVSMPSWELFARQDDAYKQSVLPREVTARVSIEMAATMGWERWVGIDGAKIGVDTFGASAPLKDLLTHFGFTVDHVVRAAKQQLERRGVK
jgi:transketolase